MNGCSLLFYGKSEVGKNQVQNQVPEQRRDRSEAERTSQARSEVGEACSEVGEACSEVGEARSEVGEARGQVGEVGEARGQVGEVGAHFTAREERAECEARTACAQDESTANEGRRCRREDRAGCSGGCEDRE